MQEKRHIFDVKLLLGLSLIHILKMLLGLVKPTEGKAQILGQTLNDKNRLEILKKTGSLIESPSYYAHLTGRENLQIVCLLKQVPEKRIDEVLHIVRMEKQQNKKAGHYSLGMKQRLGLAAALLGLSLIHIYSRLWCWKSPWQKQWTAS